MLLLPFCWNADSAGASWQWAAAAVLGSAATAAASVGLPLWEVSRFSNMEAEEIEEKVAVQQPLQVHYSDPAVRNSPFLLYHALGSRTWATLAQR